MLLLVFQLGEDRYALDAAQVVEVLPMVKVKTLPEAPRGVAGMLNYRGAPVPMIDLSEWTLGRPAQARLSTRVILVRFPDEAGNLRLLALLAEHATETLRRLPTDFSDGGVTNPAAPYLGPVTADERGLIQWVEVERLLPPAVRDVLFKEPLTTI